MTHYDVIIIGGRPAGASLAVRLAKGGLKTLVLDRATFPSKPAVPSMPLILPHTLQLLDEIGIPNWKENLIILEELNTIENTPTLYKNQIVRTRKAL